jgi:adenylate cyclase
MTDDDPGREGAAVVTRAALDLDAIAKRILGEPVLTPVQVAERASIPLERLRRMWRALGFPPVAEDEPFFTSTDLRVLELLASAENQGLLTEDEIVQIARVMGQGLARVAETNIALIADRIDRIEMPRAFELLDASEPFLAYVWRRHLISALGRRFAVDSAGDQRTRELIVGFADLVGFTDLSQEVDDRRLAQLVDRFEEIAYEHIPENRGRVIKMIGDEVMFAAEDPRDAAEIALGLVAAHAAEDGLPNIRVGLAMGEVLSWEGDLFGPTVNLASRLVQFARPSTVLVGPNIAARLADAPGLKLRTMRRLVRLKGLPRTAVSILTRAE